MTRRHLPMLAGALLFCGVAANAPAPAANLRAESFSGNEAVRVQPIARRIQPGPAPFDVQMGDGIFRLHVRGCDGCPASLTIEVRMGELWQLIRSS